MKKGMTISNFQTKVPSLNVNLII